MCLLLISKKDLNHLHNIIKLNVNILSPYVTTSAFSSGVASHSVQEK